MTESFHTWLPSFCQKTAGGGFPLVPQRKVTVRPGAVIWSRGRTTIWGGTATQKSTIDMTWIVSLSVGMWVLSWPKTERRCFTTRILKLSPVFLMLYTQKGALPEVRHHINRTAQVTPVTSYRQLLVRLLSAAQNQVLFLSDSSNPSTLNQRWTTFKSEFFLLNPEVKRSRVLIFNPAQSNF